MLAHTTTPFPEPFELRVQSERERLVVIPHGELDVATSERLHLVER
jgi:hypothetical protein